MDFKLGQVSSLPVSYNTIISWLYPLNGFRFIFTLRDSASQEYSNTVTQELYKNLLLTAINMFSFSHSHSGSHTLKGTLSRVDRHSSIHSLRDLSRSTAIMETSVSGRILEMFCIKTNFMHGKSSRKWISFTKDSAAIFCKCKSAGTTKHKENSSCGCPCKEGNVLCTAYQGIQIKCLWTWVLPSMIFERQ